MAWAIIVAALTMIVVPAKADTHSLKIGVLAPLEGAFGPLGKDAVRGYELALSEHEGRAGERPIEAFVESTDGTPDSVIAKARMLIDRGASILIGPLAGIEGIAIREFAKGVPEVTFINGASAAQDATLRAPADNFFRFNPDSMQWIAGLGRYAYEEKDIRTIVSVAEDYSLPYTQLMGFMLDYCALGGQVLARHWISTGASDAARIAKTVSGTETDALFLALEPRAAKKFLEAYAEAGGQAAIVTGATTLSGSLLKASAIRPLLEGAISALPISESDDNEAWTEFTERYRERFPDAGPSPSLFALSYYVNTKALLLALDEIDGDLGDGHEGLREALAELKLRYPVRRPGRTRRKPPGRDQHVHRGSRRGGGRLPYAEDRPYGPRRGTNARPPARRIPRPRPAQPSEYPLPRTRSARGRDATVAIGNRDCRRGARRRANAGGRRGR